MPSAIDPTKPIPLDPTTESVRDNFTIARDEISALQALTTGGPFLPLTGGMVSGPVLFNIGLGPPIADGRALGSRLVLFPAGGAELAIGIMSGGMWFGGRTTTDFFAWYAGPTQIATLAGNGWLTLTGGANIAGSLTNSPAAGNAVINLNHPVEGGVSLIRGQLGGRTRWEMWIGDNQANSGANVGSNFSLSRFTDDGLTSLGPVLQFDRQSGLGIVAGNPIAPLGIATKHYVDTFLPLAGGTLTGPLTAAGLSFTPVIATDPLDLSNHISFGYQGFGFSLTGGTINAVAGGLVCASFNAFSISMGAAADILLSRAPTQPLHATSKAYVDAAVAQLRAELGLDPPMLPEQQPEEER